MEKKEKKLTTASGKPYSENEDSMTVGPRGPILLQDFYLHEKMAHFNRERIPERVVHAKGTGAFGKFTVTNDMIRYTKASIFSKVGNECRIFIRFSVVGGEKGSADTERDPRGFAMKFYTDEGNWDLVGNNTPVFFIKDPKKFPDFIHTQKRDPKTNLKSPTMMWDFWSLNPESLHQVLILFSDRGTPYSYRNMDGFGSHTFSMYNSDNQRTWVKFHFKTRQGIKNFTGPEAIEMKGKDPDWAQRDLVDSITEGNYPRWDMKIQLMTEEQAKNFQWNPFDVTKIWPHNAYPLMDVGVLELNEIPENYFANVEQAAFAPAHTVNGIGLSPDKMLQGRILAYPDAQRYRLGVNYEQIPVNKPISAVNNFERDGYMNTTGNGGESPNYFPNSINGIMVDHNYREPSFRLEADIADTFSRNLDDDDHYTQPGWLFRKVMNDQERLNTVNNIISSMIAVEGPKRDEIIQRQLNLFFKVDGELAERVGQGLGLISQTYSRLIN